MRAREMEAAAPLRQEADQAPLRYCDYYWAMDYVDFELWKMLVEAGTVDRNAPFELRK